MLIWVFLTSGEAVQRAKEHTSKLPLPDVESERFEFPSSNINEELSEFFERISTVRPEWSSLDVTFTCLGGGLEANLGENSTMDHQFYISEPIIKVAVAMFKNFEFPKLKQKIVSEIATRTHSERTPDTLPKVDILQASTRSEIEENLSNEITRVENVYLKAASENSLIIFDVSY